MDRRGALKLLALTAAPAVSGPISVHPSETASHFRRTPDGAMGELEVA